MIFEEKLYVGASEVDRAYLGSTLVFSASTPTPTPSGSTSGSEVTITLEYPWQYRGQFDEGNASIIYCDGMRYTIYDSTNSQLARLYIYDEYDEMSDTHTVCAETMTYVPQEVISNVYDDGNDEWVVHLIVNSAVTPYTLEGKVTSPNWFDGSDEIEFDGSQDETIDFGYSIVYQNPLRTVTVTGITPITGSVRVSITDNDKIWWDAYWDDVQEEVFNSASFGDDDGSVPYSGRYSAVYDDSAHTLAMTADWDWYSDFFGTGDYSLTMKTESDCIYVEEGDEYDVPMHWSYSGLSMTVGYGDGTATVDQDCQCSNSGGAWDYDNNVCLYDSTLTINFGIAEPIEVRVLDGSGNTIASLNLQDPDNPEEYYGPDFYTPGYYDGLGHWELYAKFYGTYNVVYDNESDTDIPAEYDATFYGGQVEMLAIILEEDQTAA